MRTWLPPTLLSPWQASLDLAFVDAAAGGTERLNQLIAFQAPRAGSSHRVQQPPSQGDCGKPTVCAAAGWASDGLCLIGELHGMPAAAIALGARDPRLRWAAIDRPEPTRRDAGPQGLRVPPAPTPRLGGTQDTHTRATAELGAACRAGVGASLADARRVRSLAPLAGRTLWTPLRAAPR